MVQVISNNFIALFIGISLAVNSLVILSSTYLIYQQKFDIKCDCGCGGSGEFSEMEEQIYHSTVGQENPLKFWNILNSSDESNQELKMILRNEWLAFPRHLDIFETNTPVENIVIAHTATSNCINQTFCSLLIMSMQKYQMENRNFSDIAYNFLIGGDGNIYEGRGWNLQPACTKHLNNETICIALIGNFMDNYLPPTEKQLIATQNLLNEGVQLNKLTNDYKLFGHRQLISTVSPGNLLYNIITKWKHFQSKFN